MRSERARELDRENLEILAQREEMAARDCIVGGLVVSAVGGATSLLGYPEAGTVLMLLGSSGAAPAAIAKAQSAYHARKANVSLQTEKPEYKNK